MKKIKIQDIPEEAASHEDILNPGVWKRVLFTLTDFDMGSRLQMVNLARMPKGKGFTAHHHQDMAEIFIILKGKAKISINGEYETLRKYEAVLIPKGQVHKMINIGKTDLDYLVIGVSLGESGKTVVSEE